MNENKHLARLGILIGAAPILDEGALLKELAKRDNIYIIAVDGGIEYLLSNCIVPDYIIGDMDSASEDGKGALATIAHQIFPSIKDDTDMGLAVHKAIEEGCSRLAIFGGLGGERISHTFSNIQLMTRCAKQAIDIRMYGSGVELIAISNSTIKLEARPEGYVSILSLTDRSEDVSIKGLFYEYEGTLYNDYALGQSNEYKGTEASVSVGEGVLLIVRSLLATELHNL